MPIIDEQRDVLILRVVYDGPPFSGKTTTVRTLSQGLGVDIFTPAERDGRTLAFDWVDYTGGLFEGRQIRCQIVSVPGQRELAPRRRHLLEAADAIVVVADTRRSEINTTFTLLRDLLEWTRSRDPPIGLVLQANKRDEPTAIPRAELHDGLSTIAPIGLIETIATSGHGVREAFVFAVRLALDRVRALSDAGALPRGRPIIDNPAQLLAEMGRIEESVAPPPPFEPPRAAAEVPTLSFAVGHIDRLRRYDIEEEPAFTPDAGIPGGFIWPPVDGRALLDEAARYELRPERNEDGDWLAVGEVYRLSSARASRFEDVDAGRAALIRWARVHAANLQRLSQRRVLVLAEAGARRYRLWQLVRIEPTLARRLEHSVSDADPLQLAIDLTHAAVHLLRARETLSTPRLTLPCTLTSISADWRQPPIFVDSLREDVDDEGNDEPHGAMLVVRELGPVLRVLARDRGDFTEIVAALVSAAEKQATRPQLAAASEAVRWLAGLAIELR